MINNCLLQLVGMDNNKRKYCGGAEKRRMKNKKILLKQAEKCTKITDLMKVINNYKFYLPT